MPRPANQANIVKPEYKKHLVKCFNLVNETNHTKEHNFTIEELYTLRPQGIKRYLCLLAYGDEFPDLDVDLPTVGRSNSLEFAKKAISYFMPNKNMPWNEQAQQGNPTRSSVLNDMIKVVKKKEVRKLGKASSARRALALPEFRQLIEKVRFPSNPGFTHKYSLAAYYIFQFHMVARVDDVMHFKCDDLTPHLEFDFALKSKMCWSKNVLDKQSTSDQIILGAGDPSFCTVLSWAIHLETNIANGFLEEEGPEAKLFGINKQLASSRFKSIVDDDDFEKATSGELGSHSTRKFAATFARRNGCSKDDVDARGRWKGRNRIVDLYIDSTIPYPDAKVAAALCVGGPIKYELARDSRMSDDWVLEHVSRNIAQRFPRQMAIVLGKALLWGICDEEVSKFIDSQMVERVRADVRALENDYVRNGTNPVKKVQLVIGGNEGALVINELVEDDAEDGNDGAGQNNTGRQIGGIRGGNAGDNDIRLLVSAVKTLTRQNEELKNELHLFKSTCNTLLSQLNTSVKRIAMIPSARRRPATMVNGSSSTEGGSTLSPRTSAATTTDNNNDTTTPYQLTLCRCPKSLHVLWQEYEFGVGGRKAAKLFTANERGRVKFNYSLRKHFWNLMKYMLLKGYSHTSAIDKIYRVYGSNLSATKVLREIRKDSRMGGHPQLR